MPLSRFGVWNISYLSWSMCRRSLTLSAVSAPSFSGSQDWCIHTTVSEERIRDQVIVLIVKKGFAAYQLGLPLCIRIWHFYPYSAFCQYPVTTACTCHIGLGLPQVLKKVLKKELKKDYRTQKSTQKRRCTFLSTQKSTNKINKKIV